MTFKTRKYHHFFTPVTLIQGHRTLHEHVKVNIRYCSVYCLWHDSHMDQVGDRDRSLSWAAMAGKTITLHGVRNSFITQRPPHCRLNHPTLWPELAAGTQTLLGRNGNFILRPSWKQLVQATSLSLWRLAYYSTTSERRASKYMPTSCTCHMPAERKDNYATILYKKIYKKSTNVTRIAQLMLREQFWFHLHREPSQTFDSWIHTCEREHEHVQIRQCWCHGMRQTTLLLSGWHFQNEVAWCKRIN